MAYQADRWRRNARRVAAFTVACGMATAAYAYTVEVDAGASMSDIKNSAGTVVGKKMTIKQRTSSVPGRAELKGTRTKTTATAQGRFVVKSGGNFVSLIQSLNVVGSGTAAPISQLVLYPTATSGEFKLYVIQGGKECVGAPIVKTNVEYVVKMTVKLGETPLFEIKENKAGATFVKCQKPNPDGDVAGTSYDNGKLTSGRYFYPKLGAYNTKLNQSNNGGGSVIEWRGISIS